MEAIEQNEILTPEEKMRLLGDKLISSIIQDSDVCRKNKSYIFGIFNSDMFRNENYLIYYVLYRFREMNITLDEEFIEMYFLSNTKVLRDAGSYIDLQAFKNENEDEYTSYIGATIKNFRRLLGMQPLSEDKFRLTCEKYKIIFLQIEAAKVYAKADRILNSEYSEGRRVLMGYEDSKAFVNREFARLDAISNRDAGEGFIVMRGFEEKDDKKKILKIADWGIRELDEHFGGIFTSTFYSFLAPPKAGKTKMCANLAHKVAVENGYGVAIWALEGGRKAFDAQLRSKHFDWHYNRNITDARMKKIGVDAAIIKNDLFTKEETRQLEDASRVDLYNNPNYGEVGYIEVPCRLEDFIQNIDTMVQTINAKAIVIDYLQLIEVSKGARKSETIGEAYKSLLRYCNEKNIAIFAPAQYTQEFIKEISKSGGVGKVSDTRTSGGESSEIVRTPDVNIALWASEEDLIRNQISLLSIPSRTAKPFPKFDIQVDLSCCNFFSMPKEMKYTRSISSEDED